MVHICQKPNVMHNTKHHMFTGSHLKIFFFYRGTTAIVGQGLFITEDSWSRKEMLQP